MHTLPAVSDFNRHKTAHGFRWFATVNGVELMHPKLDVIAKMACEIASTPNNAALRGNSGEKPCK